MKIVLISSNKKWRGSEQVINSLFNYNSSVADYYLFCSKDAVLHKKNAAKENKIFVFTKGWIFLLGAAFQLKKICSELKIDLIHLNDSHSINIYILACLAGLKVPAVLHRHVNIPITNPVKYNYSKIIHIFCVSNEVKKTAASTISVDKLSVIHPGIPLQQYDLMQKREENFIKKMFSIPEEATLTGIVSAIAKEKNIDEFIEIANILIEKNKNNHFIIVGDGSLYNTYKTTYSNSHIHFTGFRDDIKEVLSCLDVFLFTSKNEGFPLVLLESMVCKVPVVSHYFPSANELVENNKTGFIYTDIKNAVEKIELLISNNSIRKNITDNAYQFVQQFDVTLMCKQIEEKYTELLNPLH
jgi:glycosyltransferase involved in cell wall biosynthesis